MGKKGKERMQSQHVGRRRAILQIDRVSRRVDSSEDVPRNVSTQRVGSSVSGMGLLGAYDDNSDDEGDNNAEDYDQPSSSSSAPAATSDMDLQVADFLKEIESMPDTTTSGSIPTESLQQHDVTHNMTQEPDTTAREIEQASNHYDYDVPYPWERVKDETTNYCYYWNTETNDVSWDFPTEACEQPPPPPALPGPDINGMEDDIDGVEEGPEYGGGLPDNYEHSWVAARTVGDEPEAFISGDEDIPGSSDMIYPEEQEDVKLPPVPEQSKDNDIGDDGNAVDLEHQELSKEAEIDGNLVADNCSSNPEIETKSHEMEDREIDEDEIPSKKAKLDIETEDEFAERLLEEALEDGQHDVLEEESMDMASDSEGEGTEGDSLLPPEALEQARKTSQEEDEEENQVLSSKSLAKFDKQEEQNRTAILDLASLLNNKLEFLEINKKKLSKFQILLIEMETRLKDWREGALDTRHVLRKLREASQQFEEHETSVAPSGWNCLWDRTQRRYYYTNIATGESQWDYPSTTPQTLACSTTITNTADTTMIAPIPQVAQESSVVAVLPLQTWTSPVVSASISPAYLPAPSVPYQTPVMMTVAIPTVAMSTMASSTSQDPYRLQTSREDQLEPPPPGHESPPPFPPGESPPPPPPEPADDAPPPPPPPPPGEEFLGAPPMSAPPPPLPPEPPCPPAGPARNLMDYSDLDTSYFPEETNSGYTSPLSGTSSPLPNIMKSKTKKKKKEKVRVAGSSSTISSKAKKVSSLVQKWQTVKQQHEQEIAALAESESEEEEDPEIVTKRKIEEWQKSQIESGKAAYNPNFEQIQGDWRERLLAKKKAATAE